LLLALFAAEQREQLRQTASRQLALGAGHFLDAWMTCAAISCAAAASFQLMLSEVENSAGKSRLSW
jgi:hypothetical protein